MEENRYIVAGWLAIVQAVLFPLGFVVGIVQTGIGARALDIRGPIIGPSELIFIAFTAIGVYTLLMFRRLLNERYENHDLDLLIIISIWWAVTFQVISIGLKVATIIYWPVDEIAFVLVYIVFMTAAMVSIGIVDIMIAVRLLKVKEAFNDAIRVFAYVTMAAGICEITVFLTPLALLLVPVTCVILAIIFLHDKQQVEFV
jgi:hypothetical protein